MAKNKFPLEPSEKELGTWTTSLIVPDAGHYLGDLTITDRRIIYLSKFDTSLNAILDKAFFRVIDEEQYLVIPRDKIQSIKAKKSMLNKKVILNTDDNRELIIDYGMLSIDSIMKALESS